MKKEFNIARLSKILAVVVLLAICMVPLLATNPVDVSTFSQGWTWNGRYMASLEGATQGDNQGQESIVLGNMVPQIVAEAGTLLIRSSQQTVLVELDGDVIYTYNPIDEQPFGKAAPSQWNLVSLPEDSQGSSITITLYSPINHYQNVVQEIRYGTELELVSWMFCQTFAKFLIGFSVAVMGGIFFLASFFLTRRHSVGFGGIFVCLLGLWCICESQFLLFLPGSSYFWGVLTFQLLWLAPIFFCLTMDEVLAGFTEVRRSTVKYVALLCGLIQWVLYVMGIYDFIEMLPASYGVLLLTFVESTYLLAQAWRNAGEHRGYIRGFSYLLAFLLASFLLECATFFFDVSQPQGLFLSVGVVLYIFGTGVQAIEVLNKESKHVAEINRDLLQQRVALVRSQIQPHFLFNTLTSIRALIRIDADKAYELVGTFSQYLRVNINAFDEEGVISFQEELNHVRTYMEIELVRFGSRVAMLYDVRTTNFFVPPLSIQPLVENAVKHGVCKREQGGTVTLRAYEEKEKYVVEVIDNGVGFDVDKIQSDGVGLANSLFRLQTLAHAKVEVKSTVGKGTTVHIVIDKRMAPEGGDNGSITD